MQKAEGSRNLRDFWSTEMSWWGAMLSQKRTKNWKKTWETWKCSSHRVLCLNKDVRSFWATTLATNYWMMWWCKFETLYGIWYRKPRRHCIPHHRKSLMTVLGIPCNPFELIHTHRSNGEVPFEECSLQTSSACRFVREPAQVRDSQKKILDVKASFRCLRLPTFRPGQGLKRIPGLLANCRLRIRPALFFQGTGEAVLDLSLSTRIDHEQVLNPTKFVDWPIPWQLNPDRD